jgi:hypothetical protein
MIYATVNGTPVKRLELNTNYQTAVARLTFTHPYQSGFDVGTAITSYIWDDRGETRSTKMFTGVVKSVIRRRPENVYEFMAQDILTFAVEHWFVPASIDDPAFTRSNISHLQLTKDILNYASITNADIIDDWTPYPTFQFATGPEPVKVNISSAWDVISGICAITGMHVYADANGKVHLSRIWDEPGETISHYLTTGNAGNMKTLEYVRSDENLRNKVAVFGRSGVSATSSGSSPYVPSGFFKTAIISYEMIDNTEMAQETADINLGRLNKLTESCVIEVLGHVGISARQTVSIVDSQAGISGNWFIYQASHRVDPQGGYTIRLTARK